MPSMSEGFSPASSIAFRTAVVPSARVVTPEPRMYLVSPTPTMAYLSRRYLGLVVSVSAGIVMAPPLRFVATQYDEAGQECSRDSSPRFRTVVRRSRPRERIERKRTVETNQWPHRNHRGKRRVRARGGSCVGGRPLVYARIARRRPFYGEPALAGALLFCLLVRFAIYAGGDLAFDATANLWQMQDEQW